MAFIALYRVETIDGLFWTGKHDWFTYEELDAELFDTEDEAIEASAHLHDVSVERIQCQPRNRGHNVAARVEYAKQGEAA